MAKVKTAYQASREALRLHGPPSPFTAQRTEAFRLIQDFSRFAEVACGCKATSNRVHVRRAVFYTTQTIPWKDLVEDRMKNDLSHIEVIARMPCPVLMPDKTMMKVQVPESAPKRIVFAGKVLRKHLSLTETQTCRGCLRRSRCRFFKAPPEPELEAGVRHIGRLLLGMAQYARGHLQFPEAYPWYFTSSHLESARMLMKVIEEHVAETSGSFFYSDIEVADEGTAREVLLRQAKKKEERRLSNVEERFLSLPQWMRETLQPIPGPGMTARQRSILAQKGITKESEPEELLPQSNEEEKDWIEEGVRLGELSGKPLFDPLPDVEPGNSSQQAFDSERPLVEVDTGQREVVKRFHHLRPAASSGTVMKEGTRVDLDEIVVDHQELQRWEEIKPDGSEAVLDSLGVRLKGGYTISQLITGEEASASDVVSISPRCLEGVHHYATGLSPRIVSPQSFEEVWNRGQRRKKKDELPFLRRLPFDSQHLETSGGALPPSRAPATEEASTTQEEDATEDLPLVDLAEDERLAELSKLEADAAALRSVRMQGEAVEGDRGVPAATSSHRSKTRGVGVFDPQVDFRYLSDPERLDHVGTLDSETSGVYFRSARPMPREEDPSFVASFRKPLVPKGAAASPVGAPTDPLGSAAPQIDLAEVKRRSEDTSELPELGEIIFPTLPGAGAPPPHRPRRNAPAAAPSRLRSLPLGTAKQVRLKDDLSDLMKPGAPRSADAALRRLGTVEAEPENPWQDLQRPSLSAAEVREHRNAAVAAQHMLYKSLKQRNQLKFPGKAGGKARGSGACAHSG